MEEAKSDLTNYYGENNPECPSEPLGSCAKSSEVIYPPQEAISKIILERIKMRIHDLTKFTAIDFQIYMPNKNVLVKQTAHRVCWTPNVLPAHISKLLGTDQEGKKTIK